MSSSELRPFVERYVPHYQQMDAKFIGNFRKKILKYILTHNFDESLTYEDVRMITGKSTCTIDAANEFQFGDNVFFKANLTKILRRVLQEGGSYWKAQKYLEELANINTSLSYHLKYDENLRP